MSNFLSPFAAHSSRPPRQLGPSARPASPDRLANISLGSDSEDHDSNKGTLQETDDDLTNQSEEVLNQFPMLNGPQRIASTIPSPLPVPTFVIPDAPASSSSSTAPNPIRPRKKVPLEPGHSALDWNRLKASNTDLRGVPRITRLMPSEIAQHKKRDDIWMAISGKVYNITHYMKFHPGGPTQLMRGAGKDATELFFKVHPWVNFDYILSDRLLVGYLIPEGSKKPEEMAPPERLSQSPQPSQPAPPAQTRPDTSDTNASLSSLSLS
ncbi:hypothetical protein HDU97_005666 [Phlyctochytrium planicorne]|nr:hypothetical protein HDU97_005666 [Phlyctochytrium planicorne]